MTDLATGPTCPSCAGSASRQFYELRSVPVHQVKLVRSRDQALTCARGDIALRLCTSCGFVWNAAFDPELMHYEEDYESTQSVSPTFHRFHERLARELIERFDLYGKKIVEIGCGQGEFISMLAELGGNPCFGFDQVIRETNVRGAVTFVKDFYGLRHRHLQPAFVCCKMTLEHIHNTGQFIRTLRETLGDRREAVVFFMTPEITRILDLCAFWDVYYEHCSYFSSGSLAHLLKKAGFDPIDVWCDYDDQYVLIAARPGAGITPRLFREHPPDTIGTKVDSFAVSVRRDGTRWRSWLAQLHRNDQRAVLWGGGSKAVAFLTTLDVTGGIEYVVDVNRKRSGTYIAGTGQQIVAPEFLEKYQPDVLIIMNPIYLDEINSDLDRMGVRPRRIVTVEAPERLETA
jgi:hypothetical protein